MSVHFSSQRQNWKTPRKFYDELNKEFNFDFDPCYADGNVTWENNGLAIDWGHRNFVNPPYSNCAEWCKKAWIEAQKGKVVVMLIPSRTDTTYWHDFVMRANEIRFVKGRLKFDGQKNSAPFPSAIIIYRGVEQPNQGGEIG